MSTEQPAAAPVNSASVASPAPAMEVDPQTDDLAAAQISGNLKSACSLDAIRTLNGLAPGSAITDYHRTQFVRAMQAQIAQVSSPLQRRQIEVASIEAVRSE